MASSTCDDDGKLQRSFGDEKQSPHDDKGFSFG
jgi:hypothetical protein